MTLLDRSRAAYARVAVACAALVIAAVAVSVIHVARPASSGLDGGVDAVLVHASSQSRLKAGMALVDAEIGRELVVSDLGTYGRSQAGMARLCARHEPDVVCVAPQPTNTLGEARAFGRLADVRGWQRVAVVTSRDHLTRAALSVRQCTDAEVAAVAADPDAEPPMRRVRDEWLRTTATATIVRAC